MLLFWKSATPGVGDRFCLFGQIFTSALWVLGKEMPGIISLIFVKLFKIHLNIKSGQ